MEFTIVFAWSVSPKQVNFPLRRQTFNPSAPLATEPVSTNPQRAVELTGVGKKYVTAGGNFFPVGQTEEYSLSNSL
jgi:hypothetical protein